MKSLSQEINLYQSSFRKVKVRFSALQVTRLALVFIVALALISVHGANNTRDLEAQSASLDQQSQELEERIASIRGSLGQSQSASAQTIEQLKAVRLQRQRALRDLESQTEFQNRLFSTYFEGLARRTLDGLWLEEIRISEGGAAIEITGNTYEAERIPQWITSLKQEQAFAGVTFRSASLDRPDATGDGSSLRFSLRTHLDTDSEEVPQ